MNPAVAEWVAKAEGDFITASRELRVRKSQIMTLYVFTASNALKNISRRAFAGK